MQRRLLLIVLSLGLGHTLQGNPVPKIRVHPTQVQTGTVYEASNIDTPEKLKEAPDLYINAAEHMGQNINVFFRGLSNPYTMVLLDGISLQEAGVGQTDLSNFSTTGADHVKLLSGPEVLLHTSQAGGLLFWDTSTKIAGSKAHFMGGSFNTARTNLKTTFKNAVSANTITANHERTAGLAKYDRTRIRGERNKYHQENMGVVSHICLGDRAWFKTSGRAMNSVLKYDEGAPAAFDKPQSTKDSTIYLIGGEGNYIARNGQWHQKLSISHARQNFYYNPSSFNQTHETKVTYAHDIPWSWRHRTRMVADTTTTQLQKEMKFQKQRTLSGIAVLQSIRLTDTWNMEAGVRQEHTQKQALAPLFTGGLSWEKDTTKIYSSWRQAARLPTLSNLYLHNEFVKANPYLKKEKLNLAELGWKQKINHHNTFQVVGFYNQLQKAMIWNPHTLALENLSGRSTIQGIETSILHTWDTAASLKTSYIYTKSSYPAGASLKPNTPMHRMYMHLEVPFTEAWSFKPSVEYVSQRYSVNQILPSCILNHLEMTYTFKSGQQIYGQIHNIWDERYEAVAGYRSPRRVFYVGMRIAF